MLTSIVQARGNVQFPAFTNVKEKAYMRKFTKAEGLPIDLARWQPTVDAMLNGVETDEPIFIMIDQSFVPANKTHRRAGLHIDGYWVESLQAHGNGGHRRTPQSVGGWESGGGRWNTATFDKPEGIILASDVQGARAFMGDYTNDIGEGGDCSNISTHGLTEVVLKPNTVYAGNVTMLHESTPVLTDCYRTVVRLNVINWTPCESYPH